VAAPADAYSCASRRLFASAARPHRAGDAPRHTQSALRRKGRPRQARSGAVPALLAHAGGAQNRAAHRHHAAMATLHGSATGQMTSADRLHRRQESPAKPRRRGASRARTLTRGKCHRQRRRSILPGHEARGRLSVRPPQAVPAILVGGGAISGLSYGTSRRCRCGTLLLYQAPEVQGS